MQNQYHCGCQDSFVPVNSNWDFNMDDACQSPCAEPRTRKVQQCPQNTNVREMEDCQCRQRTRTSCEKERTCGDMTGHVSDGCVRPTRPTCACEEKAASATRCNQIDTGMTSRSKNRSVGMINVVMQEIDGLYEAESALRAGTLFPELHKPLNGYCPYDENCGTCAQAAAFALWELRLYLNTHPHDQKALAIFRKLCEAEDGANYATTFLTDECFDNGWQWVDSPWPWEYDCQARCERRVSGRGRNAGCNCNG